MIQFIIGITLISLVIMYPSILVVALLICGPVYLIHKKPDLFKKFGIPTTPEDNSKEEESTLPPEDQEFETYQDRLNKTEEELEKNMKPGAKDDPKWEEKAKKIEEIRAQNRMLADKEMELELLKEANKHATSGNWSKVTSIEKELSDLRAK